MAFQVFLSYARNDDAPLPGSESKDKGFITTLLKAMEAYFSAFGPPLPTIFRDSREISKSDQFDPILQQEIAGSQLLLVVLSNNWIHREWCQKELQFFEQQWKHLGEHGVKSRIVVVGKNHIEDNLRPAPLRGQEAYRFYEKDEERTGRYREFFKRGKQDAEFYDAVEELARDIWSKASVDPIPNPPAPPRRGRKLYLAKPAKDMDAAYLRLFEELQNGGHVVVPERKDEMPDDAAGATEWIDGFLADADLESAGRSVPERDDRVAV